MTKCKACGTRTSASAGYCQSCKSMRHHGLKRLKEENLLIDEAGGAWWVWDRRGDVLVSGKPTRAEAVIALGRGEDDVEDDVLTSIESHAKKKTSVQSDAAIASARVAWEAARQAEKLHPTPENRTAAIAAWAALVAVSPRMKGAGQGFASRAGQRQAAERRSRSHATKKSGVQLDTEIATVLAGHAAPAATGKFAKYVSTPTAAARAYPRDVTCPKCGAGAGELCHTPRSGHMHHDVHVARRNVRRR